MGKGSLIVALLAAPPVQALEAPTYARESLGVAQAVAREPGLAGAAYDGLRSGPAAESPAPLAGPAGSLPALAPRGAAAGGSFFAASIPGASPSASDRYAADNARFWGGFGLGMGAFVGLLPGIFAGLSVGESIAGALGILAGFGTGVGIVLACGALGMAIGYGLGKFFA